MANHQQLSLLEFLQSIEAAASWKPPADFLKPFDEFHAALRDESLREQLNQAGEAIAAVVNHFASYAQYILDEDRNAGIHLDDDGLGNLVRGAVDFSGLDELIEPPAPTVFAPYADRQPADDPQSAADHPHRSSPPIIPTQSPEPLNLLELAGDDQPLVWSESIRSILSPGEPVSLKELSDRLRRPIVEVWMGCLLGGFELSRSEISEASFYDAPIMVCSGVKRES